MFWSSDNVDIEAPAVLLLIPILDSFAGARIGTLGLFLLLEQVATSIWYGPLLLDDCAQSCRAGIFRRGFLGSLYCEHRIFPSSLRQVRIKLKPLCLRDSYVAPSESGGIVLARRLQWGLDRCLQESVLSSPRLLSSSGR